MTSYTSEAMYKAVGMNPECLLKSDFIDWYFFITFFFLEHYKAGFLQLYKKKKKKWIG